MFNSSTSEEDIKYFAFSLSLSEWFNIQNYFSAYAFPVIIFLSIIANAFIITIFCSAQTSQYIAPTARFYYLAIAIVDLGSLFLYHIPDFLMIGEKVLVKSIFFTLPLQSNTACKIYAGISVFFPHCLGWTYMLFDVERLLIICQPLRRLDERKMMICVWIGMALVVIIGILCCIGLSWSFQLMTLYTGLNSIVCMANYDDFDSWFFSRILATLDLNIGPYILSSVLSVALFVCIKRQVTYL